MSGAVPKIVAGVTAVVLAACGGGGGGGGGSGGGPVVVDPGAGTGGSALCTDEGVRPSVSYGPLAGQVGAAAMTEPVVRGVPTSCTDSLRFELVSGTLPPGMQLDARSGVVSGTPTGSGLFVFEVRLSVTGFGANSTIGVTANINDVSAYTFSAWEEMTTQAPFQENFQLGTLGGKLYGVSPNGTFESVDGGATWSLVPVVGPVHNLRGFALASDPTGIYLSGGSDAAGLNSAVWRFDGADWTRLTAAGAFSPRERHAMVSHRGALYILGGRSGNNYFGDTWKSVDGGATWTLAAPDGFGPRYEFCAVSDGTSLFVMGGSWIEGATASGNTVRDVVFRTTDGTSWSNLSLPATSPLMAALATHSGACAFLAGRIVYVGSTAAFFGNSSTVSSADGVNWTYEPHHPLALANLSPGGVELGGRVYVTSGSGTSQRRVTRSVP